MKKIVGSILVLGAVVAALLIRPQHPVTHTTPIPYAEKPQQPSVAALEFRSPDPEAPKVLYTDNFETTPDWKPTAEYLARKALSGDASAAAAMVKHAADCILFTMPHQTIASVLATVDASSMPAENKAAMHHKADICESYVANPEILADVQRPAGKYPDWATDPQYWKDLAYQLREPSAVVDHDVQALTARKGYDEVQDDLRAMVENGSPKDLQIAGAIMRSGIPDNSQLVNSLSFAVAACRLSMDLCVTPETQIGGEPANIDTWAQTTLTAQQYAKVDAQAQNIVDAYRRHDSNALRTAVTVK